MDKPETEADDLLRPAGPQAEGEADLRRKVDADHPSPEATEGEPERDEEDNGEPEADGAEGEAVPEPEPESPKRPKDPIRSLVRLGWAMVVVLVVLVALLVTGMLRISNSIDKVACIQRAEANYTATVTPQATAYELGLARLAIRISLNKCGR